MCPVCGYGCGLLCGSVLSTAIYYYHAPKTLSTAGRPSIGDWPDSVSDLVSCYPPVTFLLPPEGG